MDDQETWDGMLAEAADRMARTQTPEIIDAEERFLGCVLCCGQPDLQAAALLALQPEDLQTTDALILAAAKAVHGRGEEVEQFTVKAELMRRGEYEQAGGFVRMVHLVDMSLIASRSLLPYFVKTIRKASQARKLWDVHDRLYDWLSEGDLPLEEIQARLAQAGTVPPDLTATEHTLDEALDRVMERLEAGDETPTLKIGIPTLDRLGGGLEAGEVGLICGQPGSGKTVLMEMQAQHAAETWGPVAFISLEMSRERLGQRALARRTQFSFQEIRANRRRDGGPLSFEDLQELARARMAIREFAPRIFIRHECFRLEDLVREVRTLASERSIKAVLIDYGQLITTEGRKNGTRTEEESIIARALKNEIAVPLNVPVWCLVQPNKEPDRRGKESLLKMNDILGASEWRAVANQIWLINRDPEAEPVKVGQVELQTPILLEIAKSRDGGRGVAPLYLKGERFLFTERGVDR